MERARNGPMSKDLKTEVVLGTSVVRVQEFMSRLRVLGLLELFWLERFVFLNCSALWIMCSGKMVCQDETIIIIITFFLISNYFILMYLKYFIIF